MSPRLEVVADDQWAAAVAELFQHRLRPGLRLCLATGNTVAPVYRLGGDLDGVEVFLLDEFGGLPKGDPGRCQSMIRRDLFDNASGRPEVSVPDVDSDDPDLAARNYGEAVADGGIDLAILGLGANGHIGMNEPGTSREMRTRVVTLDESTSHNAPASYGASIAPTWGITVGMAEIWDATEIWLVVSGPHKADILSRALTEEAGPHLPATLLRDHPNLAVYADESAARLLSDR